MNSSRQGRQIARSAGTYAQIVAATATMSSSAELDESAWSRPLMATVGGFRNPDNMNVLIGRRVANGGWGGAAQSWRLDEPDRPSHGGGEGRLRGRHPVTPWGLPPRQKDPQDKSTTKIHHFEPPRSKNKK